MSTLPTLADTLRRALEHSSASIRVGMPGIIKSFDPDTQLASVQPALKEVYENEEGAPEVVSLPVLQNVPVFSNGGGEFALTLPVAEGDSCWLMFSDRSIDNWIDSGGEVDPIDPRRHDLSDAVCLVGIRKKEALSDYDGDAIQMGKSGGPLVRITSDTVHIGVDAKADASEKAVLGSTYRSNEDSFFDSLKDALSAAGDALIQAATFITTAATANAVPMSGGAAAATPFTNVGVQLGQAAGQLKSVAGALASFKSGTYLSDKVKVK